jgi:hypothetical protein
MQIAIAAANQREAPAPRPHPSRLAAARTSGRRCTLVTFSLTLVPVYVTGTMSAHPRDVTGDGRLTERVRFLRAGLVTPFSGGLGIAFPWFSLECLEIDFLGFVQEVMWIVRA